MGIGTSIYSTLASLVSNKVYPAGDVPADTVTNYITYQRISAPRVNSLAGDSKLCNTRVQIDIWADTYAAAQTLRDSVRTAMSAANYKPLLLGDFDDHEPETGLHRCSMDFSIWIND